MRQKWDIRTPEEDSHSRWCLIYYYREELGEVLDRLDRVESPQAYARLHYEAAKLEVLLYNLEVEEGVPQR